MIRFVSWKSLWLYCRELGSQGQSWIQPVRKPQQRIWTDGAGRAGKKWTLSRDIEDIQPVGLGMNWVPESWQGNIKDDSEASCWTTKGWLDSHGIGNLKEALVWGHKLLSSALEW